MKKRAQVMKDKDSILQTMQELDKRKEETIKAAYKKVNKDFGDIFSNLLKGASAKLQPPDGRSLLDGLEVKVCIIISTELLHFVHPIIHPYNFLFFF